MNDKTEAIAVAAWMCGKAWRQFECRACHEWIYLDEGDDPTTPPPDCHGACSVRADVWATTGPQP